MYDLGWNIIKTTFDFAAALCYAITVKPKGARYLNLFDIQRKTVKAVKQAARIFRKGAATVAEKGNATNLVTDADVGLCDERLFLFSVLPASPYAYSYLRRA